MLSETSGVPPQPGPETPDTAVPLETCEVPNPSAPAEIGHPIAGGESAESLLPQVYASLRDLARRLLAGESVGQTLQPTALVHEAYLRLIGPADSRRFADRGHFFAAAAQSMRNILVDNARRKKREKHGGGHTRITVLDIAAPPDDPEALLAVDESLTRLQKIDPEGAEVVQLRCFAGLSIEEAAQILGVSRATAFRHWAFARAWLLENLSE